MAAKSKMKSKPAKKAVKTKAPAKTTAAAKSDKPAAGSLDSIIKSSYLKRMG